MTGIASKASGSLKITAAGPATAEGDDRLFVSDGEAAEAAEIAADPQAALEDDEDDLCS